MTDQNPYGQQPPSAPQVQYGGYAPAQPRYSVLAIVGFIVAFFISLVGLILSIIALVQIKRTGERGRGLALAGVILGAVFLVFQIIGWIFIGIAASQGYSTGTY
jgi:hypothetical protein